MDRCECFDFPVSWSFYRAHCWEVHGFDPGHNEPPEHNLNELHERLVALEEAQSEKPLADWPRNERKSKAEGVKL